MVEWHTVGIHVGMREHRAIVEHEGHLSAIIYCPRIRLTNEVRQ